jgi:hypothetical protein
MSLASGIRPGMYATRLLAALAFIAALPSHPGRAQAPARRLYVEVSSRSGGAVLDLEAADFQVIEAGEGREVRSVALTRRPARVVLMVDASDAIRQPIGQIRAAITAFLERLAPEHEMMLVTVAGTPHVRVPPTTERQAMLEAASGLFGTGGANTMHRTIDDVFHRFGQTTGSRPVFVVVTTEGFESTDNINPQQIRHVTDHFASRGGTLHGIRLTVPLTGQTFRGGALTELPVTLMIGRDTGGAYTNTSANGLLEVLPRLAAVINDAHLSAPMAYQLEYAGAAIKSRKPVAPDVRVMREGVHVQVFSIP